MPLDFDVAESSKQGAFGRLCYCFFSGEFSVLLIVRSLWPVSVWRWGEFVVMALSVECQLVEPAQPVSRGRAPIAAPLRGSLAAALRRGRARTRKNRSPGPILCSDMRALLRPRRKATAAACSTSPIPCPPATPWQHGWQRTSLSDGLQWVVMPLGC